MMESGWDVVSIIFPLYVTKLSLFRHRCQREDWDQFHWAVEATLLPAELYTAMAIYLTGGLCRPPPTREHVAVLRMVSADTLTCGPGL